MDDFNLDILPVKQDGTEQKLNMALSLTIAHQLQKLTEAIKDQTKKQAQK